MPDVDRSSELLSLTASIVAAHVSHNAVPMAELPQLIERVYQSLAGPAESSGPGVRPPPAVPIKKSITTDYIVCLEDGLRLRMLKRHLRTAFNLTPEQYRQRWGLPSDYPMVAPSYAKKRSQLARALGLGTKGRRRRG
jgi:predicted transcriptional regulator